MHKKKVWRQMGNRCATALLTAGLLAGAVPLDLQAVEALRQTTGSENQIASPVETVYPNTYTGTARSMDFNEHWKFNLGDATGAGGEVFDDSAWKDVNLPHDYSVEQNYTSSGEAESGYLPGGVGWYRKNFMLDSNWANKRISIEFDGVYMNAEVYLNGELLGSHPYGYTAFSFELPSEHLNFDSENAIAVKVNHQTPSSRWYSGSGIYRNVKLIVTDQVHIDRHGVTVTTPNNENTAGTVNIKTVVKNDSAGEKTGIKVSHTITEKGSETPVATVESEALTVATNSSANSELTATVTNRKLWNVWDEGEANLYVVHTEIKDSNDTVLDSYDTTFGFRYFNFDASTGFSFNGKNMKLRGVCMHHDQGALGGEAWYRALERQVEILKDMGCNAIRVVHNPAAEILIDICNEKGMLMIDEAFDGWTWLKNGNSQDYSRWFKESIGTTNTIEGGEPTMTWAEFDIKSMVSRGKNSPAMIMWSLGNEIIEGTSTGGGSHTNNGTKADGTAKSYADIAADLIEWVQEIDDTRPVTFGDNKLKNGNPEMKAVARKIHEAGGVVGYNYATNAQMNNNKETGWKIYGSETASATNSRGVYNYKGGNAQTGNQRLTAYDKSCVTWGATASDAWYRTITMDANAGEFVWTGFDYLGEPTPWNKVDPGSTTGDFNVAPKSSYFGIIETTGFPKDSYYLYRSMWNAGSDTLHILPTWNEEDVVKDGSGNVEVVVYSNAHKVELFLNGESQGEKTFTEMKSENGQGMYTYKAMSDVNGHTSLYRTWNVPYEAGTLTAKAYDENGQEITNAVGRSTVKTTGAAAKLDVTADRAKITADGKDLSYITIDVEDAQGNFINGAEPEISVSVTGNGKLMALDNGSQSDHTPYHNTSRKAFNGKLLAIVQSTDEAGSFTVTARANGLVAGSVEVTTEAQAQEGGSGDAYVRSLEYSRIYYVKKGTALTLPNEVKVNYSDGTTQTKTVTWDDSTTDTNTAGVTTRTGKIEGNITVTVRVNVLEEITALLNYSAALPKGAELNLPATRPAVMADGEILDAYFPVTWNTSTVNASVPGTYLVQGTAQVFGETLNPTATVRVSEGSVLQGDNVAFAGENLYYGTEKTDALEMIRDGEVAVGSEAWTGSGEIKYEYVTAQNINKVVLHLKDTAPVSSTMSLEWSPDGTTWTPVDAKVSNAKEEGKTVRTFTFDIVPAVWLKLKFDSPVKLLESELYVGIADFGIGTSASLEELVINGRIIEESTLAAGSYGVQDASLTPEDLEVVGKDNASYTILPEHEGKILILTESEDHASRGSFELVLGQGQASNMEADDDSHDYPYTKTTATAGSQQTNQEASKAVDGDTSTLWHTSWTANLADQPDQRYIELTLEEPTIINALRYLPRPSGPNGVITKYIIKVKTDANGEWQEVAKGDWASNNSWKIASFPEVEAKYVRLEAEATTSDTGANKFVSATEIRVCVPYEDLFDVAQASLEKQDYDYTGQEICPEPAVTLKDGGAALEKDVDYTVSYRNNVNPGTRAAVLIEGTGGYSGIIRLYFTINDVGLTVVSFEEIDVYTEVGEEPILPGTITATLSGGTTEEMEVTWPAIAPEQYAEAGEFFVTGEVAGESLKPMARVIVSGALGVEQVSLVTVSGITPTMPTQVIVYESDGSETPTPVVWDMEGVSFTGAAGTIVTVEGTVEGKDLKAIAKVRLAEGTVSADNWALNAAKSGLPLAIAYVSSGLDNPFKATDGSKTFTSDSNKQVWSDWERGVYHTDINWMGVILGSGDTVEKKMISKVSVGFMEEDGTNANKVKLPAGYRIEYYVGPEDFTYDATLSTQNRLVGNGFVKDWDGSPLKDQSNWKEVTYTGTKPGVPALADFKKMVDVSFEPVSTRIIRISLTPQANQWTGLEEFEVYGYDLAVNDSFEVESITIGGVDITGQITTDAPYEYTLDLEAEIPEITATATNNASVTILQPLGRNGVAKIIIKPENGNEAAAEIYEIQFISDGIEVGLIELKADPVEGEKLAIDAPRVVSGLRVTKQGWQIQMPGSDEWEDFDINTVMDPIYVGAKIRYYAENANGFACSNIVDIESVKEEDPGTGPVKPDLSKYKTELNGLIKQADEAAASGKYTDASLKAVDTHNKTAKTVLNSASATEAQFKDIIAKLKDALAKLEEKKADNPPAEPPKDKPWIFTDVDVNPGAWKYESVKYVYNNDIMGAITGTTEFQPDRPLSRSMFATVLYRMADSPAVTYADTFSDVPAGKWYSDAIIWANQKGIVQGLSDGSFGIDNNITREQIAKMLFEYADKVCGFNVSDKKDLAQFTDADAVSNWAVGYMQWATAVEMITGKPNDAAQTSFRMDPKGEATRAECAAMLMRFENKYVNKQ